MASQRLFGKSWNSSTSFTMKALLFLYFLFIMQSIRLLFLPHKSSETVLKRSSSKPVAMSRKPSLSFKSLFGKRSLRRRIFFSSKKVRSIILLNVITRVFASSIPVVKEVEGIVDPASFTVVRFALSALPFIPFVLRAQDDFYTRNAGIELGFWVSLGLSNPGTGLVWGYLIQALGLLTSDAGRAIFLSMLTVIVVPLLDGMLGAVVPARTWFGALMALLGVAMLDIRIACK